VREPLRTPGRTSPPLSSPLSSPASGYRWNLIASMFRYHPAVRTRTYTRACTHEGQPGPHLQVRLSRVDERRSHVLSPSPSLCPPAATSASRERIAEREENYPFTTWTFSLPGRTDSLRKFAEGRPRVDGSCGTPRRGRVRPDRKDSLRSARVSPICSSVASRHRLSPRKSAPFRPLTQIRRAGY